MIHCSRRKNPVTKGMIGENLNYSTEVMFIVILKELYSGFQLRYQAVG